MDRKVNPYPFIWADEAKRPHLPDKTHLSPKLHNWWHGWVTHARIDENPVIRGHDLCFDKTCRKTSSRYVRGWLKGTVQIITGLGHNIMLPKQASKLDLRKYYSLYGGMWNLFCRDGHYPRIQILL